MVEVSCDISQDGVKPHRFDAPSERNMALIRQVKLYERLGARAILTGDSAAALDCLMLHPLINSWSLAKALCAAYCEHNRSYLTMR